MRNRKMERGDEREIVLERRDEKEKDGEREKQKLHPLVQQCRYESQLPS